MEQLNQPKQWLPQDCALVRFADDPTLLHGRVVLRCYGGNLCRVITPDRDVQESTLEVGSVYTEVIRMKGARLPRGIKEDDTYLPKHSGDGDFRHEELLHFVRVADRVPSSVEGRKRVTGKVDGDGAIGGIHGDPAEKPRPKKPDVRDKGDDCWIKVYSSLGTGIGDRTFPPVESDLLVCGGGLFKLYREAGTDEDILAKQVQHEDLGVSMDVARMGAGVEAKSEKDVRVLSVLFDSADERRRTIHEAVPELEEVEYEDFPLQGPRTLFRDVRQLRRLGLDFCQHHESWLKKSGVRAGDRSVHEHASICRALNWMLCYDQLNICGLASAEALNRRRTLIEFAHQGRPETPSYEGAEDILGVRESADGSLIDPAITQHAARRAASKAEVLKQQRLAAEERWLTLGAPVLAAKVLQVPSSFPLNHSSGMGTFCLCLCLLMMVSQRACAEVLNRVYKAHLLRPPPVDKESPQAALRQLLKKKVPTQLEHLLPQAEADRLRNFREEMMLSEEEIAGVIEKGLENKYYIDPVLSRDPRAYHELVADLVSSKLLSFTGRPKSQVGVFAVTKKNDKQRLIVDARRTNAIFRTPPTTLLGSVESWGRLEVGSDEDVFVAQEDVRDFFYRLGISKDLGEYFSLPAVDPERLQKVLGYLPVELEQLMQQYPELDGWSTEGPPQCSAVRVRVAAAPRLFMPTANHLGISAAVVEHDQKALLHSLHSNGLDTHEHVCAVTLAESLGVRIDGLAGQVRATPHRDWRLDRAIAALSTRLWKSVAEELDMFRHLSVLGVSNFKSPWSQEVLCTDASLSGYAVMSRTADPGVVGELGRYDERWRFRLGEARHVAPRASALALDPFSDPSSVKPEVEGEIFGRVSIDDSFPQIKQGFMEPENWSLKTLLKGHQAKRKRAADRQKKFAMKLRATQGERSILELSSVKEPQRRDYAKKLDGFYGFVEQYQLRIADTSALDAALCDWADILYLNGEGSNYGDKLLASLEFERPEFAREGKVNLPRFRRALKGWRRMAPTQTRLPMIEFIKGAISGVLLKRNLRSMALFNEVTYSTYSRPGELLRVCAEDFVKPNQDQNHAVIVLSPLERGESSKPGQYDEVLILDDKRAPWLPFLMEHQANHQMRAKGPDALMWDFTAAAYLKHWREAVETLGVEAIATSPYQNRHGGASRDHLLHLRSMSEIRRRGRWASDSSLRIYDKPGRLQQAINQWDVKLRAFGEDVRRNFRDYFLNGGVQIPHGIKI
ncbi:unnamed protein product [Symbiodinium sp. CCMP2592]|nr:unnamed protein product [Symbiodinium sp. CCMP2592]